MEAIFHKAAYLPPARCLGAPLLPLTIGHLFLLRKHCPDVLSADDAHLGSLALAAFICAHPQCHVEQLLRRRTAAIAFRVWGLFSKKFNLALERDRFEHYLQEHLEPPKIWHDLSNPLRACQAPLEMRLLVLLMTEMNFTEKDALDVPVVKANALWATLGELRGKFTFEDERTTGLLEFAKRMDAERLDKLNKEN